MGEYTQEFMKFLSQLRAATGDLSSLTCPAFLLNGASLLEYSQVKVEFTKHWMDHPDLLYNIKSSNPGSCERMVACVAWYISTLYGSYRQRCENSSERKPFNPILGEIFKAEWEDINSEWKQASLTVEQVCHHPPVSAFRAEIPNPLTNTPFITAEGHCGQKSSISTSTISVRQEGRAKVVVYDSPTSQETFIIHPLPDLTIAGLLTMQAFLELIGKTKITSSAGTKAEIEFIPCGKIS